MRKKSQLLLTSSEEIKASKMKKILIILLLTFTFNLCHAPAQIPIADYLGRHISKITSVVSEAIQVLNNLAEPLIKTIGNAKEFLDKSETVVNGSVKNMKLIQSIIKTNDNIIELYDKSLNILNDAGENPDDPIDYSVLDKAKHLQILLGLSKQTLGGFSIFTNLIEDDAFTMDDKSRIVFLQETDADLKRIKSAMRVEIRRINKQILSIKRLHSETGTFKELFKR